MKVEEDEMPGKAEDLQQFYNSEYWENAKETFIRTGEAIIEAVKPLIESVSQVAFNLYNEIKVALQVDPEVKKCYGIYKRTKKGRIRKKQMSRISKIIKRRTKTNGNMDKDAG